MIDGLAGRPFSAHTLPPLAKPLESNVEKIIDVCREKYGTPRQKVEEDISKRAGVIMETPMPLPKKQPVLYDAKCDNCQKPTKVVFPPDGKRPVYCKSCLKKIKPSPRTSPEGRAYGEGGQPKQSLPSSALSLEEADEKRISFSQRPRREGDFSERKKRKEVDVEELKKTLEDSLKNYDKNP